MQSIKSAMLKTVQVNSRAFPEVNSPGHGDKELLMTFSDPSIKYFE